MMHQSSCTRPTRGEHPLWRTTGYMQLRKKMLVYTLESCRSVCVCIVCVVCGVLLCVPVVLCVLICVLLCACACGVFWCVCYVMWCVPLVSCVCAACDVYACGVVCFMWYGVCLLWCVCVLCGMVCACGGVCVMWCGVYVSCHCVWVKVVSHYNQDGLSPNPGEILRMFCPRIHVGGCLFYVFFCANGLTSDWVLFSAGLPIGHCWCGLFRERAFFLHLMVKVMSLLFSGTARCFCCSENTRSCCWWSGRQCSGSCDSTWLCAHAAFPAACLHCVTEENKRPLRDFQH